MNTMYDKLTQFTYVTRKKYGSDSFAAGYLSSMVDEMIREIGCEALLRRVVSA